MVREKPKANEALLLQIRADKVQELTVQANNLLHQEVELK